MVLVVLMSDIGVCGVLVFLIVVGRLVFSGLDVEVDEIECGLVGVLNILVFDIIEVENGGNNVVIEV